MVAPDPVDHHASGEWVVWRNDPIGERQPPAAREPAVAQRRNLRRAATSDDRQEPRLDERAFSGLRHRRKVERWRFVRPAGLRYEAALEVDLDAFGRSAGHGSIARPVWRKSIIAVPDARGDRQSFRKLPGELAYL